MFLYKASHHLPHNETFRIKNLAQYDITESNYGLMGSYQYPSSPWACPKTQKIYPFLKAVCKQYFTQTSIHSEAGPQC